MKKLLTLILVLSTLIFNYHVFALADTPTPTPSGVPTPTPNQAAYDQLQQQISDLQNRIAGAQEQEKTLSSAINVMNNQISLTQLQINSTEQQISELTSNIQVATTKVNTLQNSLANITKVLLQRIVATYEAGNMEQTQALLASSNLNDLIERASYMKIVQEHDKKLIYDTQQAQNDYANQKQIFEVEKQKVLALQTQLQQYSSQLDAQKQQKQQLLSETQGDEATYEHLLAQAKAQLSGFSNFVNSQGGASLLSGQTVCDDGWSGCYYNQRDTQWGGSSLNGTSYSIAEDGCLMTSVAMVYTHYGYRSVTPLTVNSNSSNFASYEPAFLDKTVSVNGASLTRNSSMFTYLDPDSAKISAVDSAGSPAIVGISYDSGPLADHFVVIISGSNGNYMMNDPYTESGNNISFTSKYSINSIREVDHISM